MLIESKNCRICLEDHFSSGTQSLQDKSPIDGCQYADVYYFVSGHEPTLGPQNLCGNCITRLVEAYKLKERITDVEEQLNEYLNSICKVERNTDRGVEEQNSHVETVSQDVCMLEPGEIPNLDVVKEERSSPGPTPTSTIEKVFVDLPTVAEIKDEPTEISEPSIDIFSNVGQIDKPEPIRPNLTLMALRKRIKEKIQSTTKKPEPVPANEVTADFHNYGLKTITSEEMELIEPIEMIEAIEEVEAVAKKQSTKLTEYNSKKIITSLGYCICPFCPYTSIDSHNFRRHMRHGHSEKSIKCINCYLAFTYSYHLEKHINGGCKPKKYDDHPYEQEKLVIQCQHCSEIYNDYFHLALHCKLLHSEMAQTCDACEEPLTFYIPNQFTYHRRRTHISKPKTSNEKPESACDICLRTKSNGCPGYHPETLHIQEMTDFICEICGLEYNHRKSLMKHMLDQHFGSVHTCRHCKESFSTYHAKYLHEMRTHRFKFPHQCKVCKKRFVTQKAMTHHLTLHSGEKNYECDICSARFFVKSKLREHIHIHFTISKTIPGIEK